FRLDEQCVAKEQQEKDLIEKKYVSRLKDFTELGFKEEGEFIVNGAFKLPISNVKEMTDEQHANAINFHKPKDVVEKPVAETKNVLETGTDTVVELHKPEPVQENKTIAD